MLLVVLVCSLPLAATAQRADNDWIDPYDMLHYDDSAKAMRTPAESGNYANKRGEEPCSSKVVDLQKQVEELKKTITVISQQHTCNPVFKRFLSRLLKKVQGLGLPSDNVDVLCDAKIQLSKQAMAAIQRLLEGEDSGGTGALDDAISQILVDLRPHDHEAWKWRFEDTFGVELDTILKMGLCVLVIMAIICTQLWSRVSWFVQFSRLFAVCFFVSIIWNWCYLYKIAFAEHQNRMAKLHNVNEKCTGMKKIDWSDNLKEWFRSTWTLQDDPCKTYYEVILVNPILLVPPTKAISVTLTTFITEPLKHIGQGISEFLRALLKDLPVTLQIPVLLTIVLAIVVCMYGSVHAAFQHGITAPFRGPRRDPPEEQMSHRHQRIEYHGHLAGGDAGGDTGRNAGRNAPQQAQGPRADDGRMYRNQVYQRWPNRSRQEPAKVPVETLHAAQRPYCEDEPDAELREADSEKQEELAGASAISVAANAAQSKSKPTESDASPSKTKPTKSDPSPSKSKPTKSDPSPSKRKPTKSDPSQEKTKPTKLDPSQSTIKPTESDPSLSKTKYTESDPSPSQDELSGDSAASLPALTDFQESEPSAEDRTPSVSLTQVETVGVSVQESSQVLEQTTCTSQED